VSAVRLLPLLLLAAAPAADADERTFGDVTARIAVHVAGQAPQPGEALVFVTLTVTGGPGLDVESPPRLSDPSSAWEATRTDFERYEDGRRTWTEFIRLRQTKPGKEPLPDVKLRFRESPSEKWEETEWTDLLKMMSEAPGVEASPPAAGWPWQVEAAAAAVAALALLAAAWFLARRRPGPRKPLPPDRWALQELTRIEQKFAPPAGPSEAYHTLLSNVVRRYLAERFGLPAPRQTTAEFLATVRKSGRLSAEQQTMLRDFLERCDLAKFANAPASPDECRRAAALASDFIQQTSAAAPQPT
jgi:hypothetical protein